jgi:AcrR family transcriptional regulator
MCQRCRVGVEQSFDDQRDEPGARQRRAIHAAAIAQFSAQGFAATSMADIADAAGMSRTALYQYFRNKRDIFASAFVAIFEDHVDRALQALQGDGTTEQRLEGLLQRFEGDLWELMAASEHSDEIMSAKTADTAEEIQRVITRLRSGVTVFLAEAYPGRTKAGEDRRAAWAEILEFSPKGFKFDTPSVATFRRRLTALARGVAADIDA